MVRLAALHNYASPEAFGIDLRYNVYYLYYLKTQVQGYKGLLVGKLGQEKQGDGDTSKAD